MKKIGIIIALIVIFVILMIAYKVLFKKELRLTLPNDVVEINGNKEFSDAEWGVTGIACEKGGFNLTDYAGKDVAIQSSLSIGKFYHADPLNLNKIYMGNNMICAYYSDAVEGLAPGIFAVNDPTLTGWW
jgi:hypothetical protein